jgi:hypothetical protein
VATVVTVRRGDADHVEAAVELWHLSSTARRDGVVHDELPALGGAVAAP